MIRRIELLVVAAVLVIAAFSTALPFLFYLLYLGDPRHRRLVRAGPARPGRPRGGLRGQPAPWPRRRPDARDLHAAQHAAGSPSPGWRSTTRRRCPAGCPAGRSPCARPERAILADPDAAHPPRPLPHRAAAHPDRRPVRLLRGVGDGGPGRSRWWSTRDSSRCRAGACRRPTWKAATPRPSGRSRRRRWRRPSGRTRRATHEPDPLEGDRPPRRDPGQGVRPGADRRRLDHPRPPARHRRPDAATSRRSRPRSAPPPRSRTRRSPRTGRSA